MKTVEAAFRKAAQMKMNAALVSFQLTKIRDVFFAWAHLWKGQNRSRCFGAARVGVQLCLHERKSCGYFAQLDKAKSESLTEGVNDRSQRIELKKLHCLAACKHTRSRQTGTQSLKSWN